MAYAHLHVHSEYSFQDSTLRIEDLVSFVANQGMTHVAVTDHHYMMSAFAFEKACGKHGITPIFGTSLLIDGFQWVILAENQKGYANLVKLSSYANSAGKVKDMAHCSWDQLQEFKEGLILLTGGMAGELYQLMKNLNNEEAYMQGMERVQGYLKTWSSDHLFLEVTMHGLPEEERLLPIFQSISQATNIPLVATNDVHYLQSGHAYPRALLTQLDYEHPPMWEAHTQYSNRFYLTTENEMRSWFVGYEDAVNQTQIIADRCSGVKIPRERDLPDFPLPAGETLSSFFEKECWDGLITRGLDHLNQYREQLIYEIDVIKTMGFEAYFLIVSDFIKYAKSQGISVGPGRGSAAGSLASYCLYITEVDPIENNLYFERFLNPHRVSMPDVDIDFCFERRGEVIDYVSKKYGSDRVSQIATFGTLGTKAVIKDVGRVLGLNYSFTDQMSKEIEKGIETLEQAKNLPYFQELLKNDSRVVNLFAIGEILEGLPRQFGMHAAGVIIAKKPLQEYCPVVEKDGILISQWDKYQVEAIGILKMDFLGLKTLTIMDKAFDEIARTTGKRYTVKDIPKNDPKTYDLLMNGKSARVFQLESKGMMRTLRDTKCSNFEDIVTVLSLYRPGPMDYIPQYIQNKFQGHFEAPHPIMIPILQSTHGIMIYQEQILKVAQELAGYSLGEADILRRAIGGKKKEVLEQQNAIFVEKAVQLGVDPVKAQDVYDMILKFADYGFNRAHAVSYAYLSEFTAWQKAHYPEAFMAANLTVAMDDNTKKNGETKLAMILQECKRMGIHVLPPSIRHSKPHFSLEETVINGKPVMAIRYGLLGIRSVGENLVNAIIAVRDTANWSTFQDVVLSVPDHVWNKAMWENLISANVFAEWGNRGMLFTHLDSILAFAKEKHHMSKMKQKSLFNLGIVQEKPLPIAPDRSLYDLLKQEKHVMEVVLSGHPLDSVEDVIESEIMCEIRECDENTDGDFVRVAGIWTGIQQIVTKKGSRMAVATLEDPRGEIEVVIFPKQFELVKAFVKEMLLVYVSGRVQYKAEDGKTVILAEDIEPILAGRQVIYIESKGNGHEKALIQGLSTQHGITQVYFWNPETHHITNAKFAIRMNHETKEILSKEKYFIPKHH